MRRTLWLAWLAFVGGFGDVLNRLRARGVVGVLGVVAITVLGSWREARAESTPSSRRSGHKEVIVCTHPGDVPSGVNIWARVGDGRAIYDRERLVLNTVPSAAVLYVFSPDDPICRKKTAVAKPDAPAPPKPSAAPKKEAPKKKDEPKKDEAPKSTSPSKRPSPPPPAKAEAEKREAPQHAEEGREDGARPRRKAPPPGAVSGVELAKRRHKEPSVLETMPRSALAMPMTSSACPGCGTVITLGIKTVAAFQCRTSPPPGSYKPGPDGNPAEKAAVREPILKELLAYEKESSDDERELNREALWTLFDSISAPMAEAFQVMLASQDSLAVKLRSVLDDDPFQKELIRVLEKKYICQPPPPPPAPPPPPPPPEVTLPLISLTEEASFEELDAQIQDQLTAIAEGTNRIVRFNLMDTKVVLLKRLALLERRFALVKQAKDAAFKETDSVKKAEGLKRSGERYLGLFYFMDLWKLYVNIGLVTDSADAKGLATGLFGAPEDSPLGQPFLAFNKDEALIALLDAGFNGDAKPMAAALPEATEHYEAHAKRLDRWAAGIEKGEVLSKKVVKVADIMMIAISIYQVAKMPVLPPGTAPTPPTIIGTLPGGAAIGSTVSLASIARAEEAIRKLVEIGALDGALVVGLGKLGGGPGFAIPEFQRPTNMQMAAPKSSQGAPSTPAARAQTIDELVKKAEAQYPKKAGKWEWHHVRPRYLNGPKNGRVVRIKAAYHQFITNEFRIKVPYGTGAPDKAAVDRIMNEVYDTFPLPE